MSQGTSPPKDKGPATEPGKTGGIKRLQTDTPSSPVYHNVYVRRKVESEHSSKVNPSQELKGNGRDKAKEQEAHQDVQHEEVNSPQLASPVAESVEIVSSKSPEKTNSEIAPEKTEPPVASGTGMQEDLKQSSAIQEDVKQSRVIQEDVKQSSVIQEDAKQSSVIQEDAKQSSVIQEDAKQSSVIQEDAKQSSVIQEDVKQSSDQEDVKQSSIQEDVKQSSIQYWNERFNRLQTYLENCDHSTQDGYLRKLRSLSAAGRSMHAIELEKRAIHLLVEEGKELQRMKALNVLGKVSPNASSKPTPLQRQSQK